MSDGYNTLSNILSIVFKKMYVFNNTIDSSMLVYTHNHKYCRSKV